MIDCLGPSDVRTLEQFIPLSKRPAPLDLHEYGTAKEDYKDI